MGFLRKEITEDGKIKTIHKIVVHRFTLPEMEDPMLHAGVPLFRWQESDAGKFIMKHAEQKPIWHKNRDIMSMSWQFVVVAEIEEKKLSEYYLRFDKSQR